MTHYDYKVVPAPTRAKRMKGVQRREELFALTLTEAINEVARQGWEYLRAETLPAEAPRGWFRARRCRASRRCWCSAASARGSARGWPRCAAEPAARGARAAGRERGAAAGAAERRRSSTGCRARRRPPRAAAPRRGEPLARRRARPAGA